MHDWKPVKTWKTKRRSYQPRGQRGRWRTEWRCATCGIVRQKNHEFGGREPDLVLDTPPADFKVVSDQGRSVLGCEDMVVNSVMES